MKPGRELDALVAEKVMEWSLDGRMWKTGPNSWGYHIDDFRPSENISSAFELVSKLTAEGWEIIVNSATKEVKITLWNDAGFAIRQGKAFGESEPHAICLATLKAMGIIT